MPKFLETLRETVSYQIEIEAPNGDEAVTAATEKWADCTIEEQYEHFDVTAFGVEVDDCEVAS